MKAGLIRCMQTEGICPATTDLMVMKEKKTCIRGHKGRDRSDRCCLMRRLPGKESSLEGC